jgi:6-pyruvoyltetrahydropterin/6-carboxytetrahydropterin synthase
MKISKSFSFDASHQLINHAGKCANLHGHTYNLEVCVSGTIKEEKTSDEGMVYDFGDLKKIVNEQILDHFDHAVILQGNEPIAAMMDTKRVLFGQRTTAENMAVYMAYVISKNLPENITLSFVRLWETGSSYAETEAEDLNNLDTAHLEKVTLYGKD